MKTRLAGFQKPLKTAKTEKVGLAIIRDEGDGRVWCNCGWSFTHRRARVRDDRGQTHVNRKHGGAAAWI